MERALRSAYPEHQWDWLKFKRASSDSSVDVANHLAAIEDLGKNKFGILKLEDWYGIRKVDFERSKFASILLRRYNGSLVSALQQLYPNHKWQPWRFTAVPRGWWKEQKNLQQFFDAKAAELGVHSLEQWYSKSFSDIGIQGASFYTP